MRLRSKSLFIIMVISLSIAVLGCARTLQLKYKPFPDTNNLLASVSPMKIKLMDFTDKREGNVEPGLIGGIQEKPGAIITHIQSDRTVSEIVRDALKAELVRNGHSVVDDNEDIVMKGEIKTFWLRTEVTKENWDVIGEIEVMVEVLHAGTGNSAFLGPYYAKTIERRYLVPANSVMTRILEKSLSKLMQQIRSDSKLATALEKK